MSIERVLKQATAALTVAGFDTPQLDAQVLLMFVLGVERSYLYTWPDQTLSAAAHEQFDKLLQRRLQGEPVAYLTGNREFWSLPFEVSSSTLIPRPDTEVLVETALSLLADQPAEILELGTGTGAIAIALKTERPQWRITAVDKVPAAVALAKRNAERLLSTSQQQTLQVRESDWFQAIAAAQQFQLIVSNPPYLAADDPHLQQGDVRFEPQSALVADAQGFADYQAIIRRAPDYLVAGGWLLFEHGCEQGQALRTILTNAGYENAKTWLDYAGLERVTGARWCGSHVIHRIHD
ncbi:MAG: peptide chain release factor N(5)-glutamine methyltransferase [Gammaproteobacteria bacterium]|nr:peptide chain release factor N(5)-glutamine methyltransferase [Gammaproteobacteria bacterium]MCL5255693.1 peptide chain release factor N(5)-glutamine methyltransferase [Gammaproteobacteria bacterium]